MTQKESKECENHEAQCWDNYHARRAWQQLCRSQNMRKDPETGVDMIYPDPPEEGEKPKIFGTKPEKTNRRGYGTKKIANAELEKVLTKP